MKKQNLLLTTLVLAFSTFAITGCLSSTEIDSTSDEHIPSPSVTTSDNHVQPPVTESSEPPDKAFIPSTEVTPEYIPEYIIIGGKQISTAETKLHIIIDTDEGEGEFVYFLCIAEEKADAEISQLRYMTNLQEKFNLKL